jgi:hypothetical protein
MYLGFAVHNPFFTEKRPERAGRGGAGFPAQSSQRGGLLALKAKLEAPRFTPHPGFAVSHRFCGKKSQG